MLQLIEQYETKKSTAIEFMNNGQLNAYFKALVELNHYKKLMLTVSAN